MCNSSKNTWMRFHVQKVSICDSSKNAFVCHVSFVCIHLRYSNPWIMFWYLCLSKFYWLNKNFCLKNNFFLVQRLNLFEQQWEMKLKWVAHHDSTWLSDHWHISISSNQKDQSKRSKINQSVRSNVFMSNSVSDFQKNF